MTRIADTIAAACHAHGIRHAFGMPGGEVVTLIDALERAGIRFTLARNETAAAMMAAGAGVECKTPGLLVTTLGPGLANAVNGIADAVQERNPLLVISGVVERGIRARYTHQIVDHAAMLRPLVKASFEIEPEGAAAVVARAIALALTAPFGPVHLDLSPAVAAMAERSPVDAPVTKVHALALIDPAHPALAAARARLAQAKAPLVIAGLEAARAGAGAALLRLAEATGAPVVTTYKAKGVIDENHPLAMGGAGLSPLADKVLLDLVRKADLVLLAGYDPMEMRPGWLDPFAAGTHVLDITAQAHDHGMHAPHERLLGPVPQILAALTGAARPGWPGGEPDAAKAALAKAFAPPAAWGPHAVFARLQARLPRAATVTVDSGAHRILLSQMWRARRPFEMLQSAGWCTMGSAIPLAIGVQTAHPAMPVVAVLGDGGLEMTMGELGTLRDNGLPVIVVVLQDESLALIELKQAQAGLAVAGVRMGATRYDDVARAFGGHGAAVDSAEALDAELEAALTRRDMFTLIACTIKADAYAGRL